jgi:hypothetical protein
MSITLISARLLLKPRPDSKTPRWHGHGLLKAAAGKGIVPRQSDRPKTWRTSLSLSEESRKVVESITNSRLGTSASDAVDNIIINWATKSDTGRAMMEALKEVEKIE